MNSKRNIIQAFALLALLAGTMLGFVFFTTATAAERKEPALDLLWQDDFEDYPPGDTYTEAFPFANWTHEGLKDAFVYTDQYKSGSQSLKMHGVIGNGDDVINLETECNGSVAYREIGYYAHVEVEAWMRNEDDPLSGCHQKYTGLEFSTEPSVFGDHRGLLAFAYDKPTGDYEIRGGAFEIDEGEGTYLMDFIPLEWYKVRVVYDYDLTNQTVQLQYYVNDVLKGADTLPAEGYEVLLNHVGLWVGESAGWFDDVAVHVSDPIDINFADLSITKEAAVSSAPAGRPLNYSLTIRNDGPLEATSVVVTDPLPAGVTFQSATASAGSCSASGGIVTCNLGTIPANGIITIDLRVTAPTTPGSITNTAEVGSERPDPDTTNNQASVTVNVLDVGANTFYLPLIKR